MQRRVNLGGRAVSAWCSVALGTAFSLLAAATLFVPESATAQDGTGATVICDGQGDPNCCMDDLFPGNLNCTANDVRISGVADTGTTNMDGSCSPGPDGFLDECDISFEQVCDAGAFNAGADCMGNPNICLDGNQNPDPSLCGDRCAFEGDTTSFTATFEVLLTAQERYDIGLYFAVDGDPNMDGALTGQCAVSTLPEVGSFTRPDLSTGNYVDLDSTCTGKDCPQPQDLCGDIDSANNPIFYDPAVGGGYATVVCVANENGKLNLPNCTSWRQSGANDVCLDPLDAFPGSPSKCNCQPEFEVPIEVPQAELLVVKTANPTSVDEPGGLVTFEVSVTNQGIDPNNDVTLDSLTDTIYGNLDADDVGNHTWVDSTCLDDADGPVVITRGGTYTCTFTANVSGNGGDSETDTVTASGVDDNGNDISGEDDATVTINNVAPDITVVKTATPEEVLEPGGEVTFLVEVTNDSVASSDPVTINSLSDSIYGDLNGRGDCSVPQVLLPGDTYSCSFTEEVTGNTGDSETDTVTASGTDDDGTPVEDSDSATVTVLDVPSNCVVTKSASPEEVDEPGGMVTFTVGVQNTSAVDTVTIESLVDEIDGVPLDLNGRGDCSVPQVLLPGDTYSCSFTAEVTGNAGDMQTDTAKASGTDDDGQGVICVAADATVTVNDVPPAASLTKTATTVLVTYTVVVTNDSTAEALTLFELMDNPYGNIADPANPNIVSTGCSVPQTIAIGDSYTCSFTAEAGTGGVCDTLTGTVDDDDDISLPITPSDSEDVSFGDVDVCEAP